MWILTWTSALKTEQFLSQIILKAAPEYLLLAENSILHYTHSMSHRVQTRYVQKRGNRNYLYLYCRIPHMV